MQRDVIMAGFGGQGILLIGKMLAYAGMREGKEVSWLPSYGPEMRGGTAYCMVIMSDRPIGSPIVKNPQHLVAMNRPSLEKFAPVVKPGGVVLINSTLIPVRAGRDDVDELAIPVNDLALEAGSVRSANVVALAAFAAAMAVVPLLGRVVVGSRDKKPPVIVPAVLCPHQIYHRLAAPPSPLRLAARLPGLWLP